MIRQIVGLHSAKTVDRPLGIPVGRPRGVKRDGVNFERDFFNALQNSTADGAMITHGQWFAYTDSKGNGVCQTDVLMELPSCVIVFECKYTWVEEAELKLNALYLPVVSRALGKPAIGVVVVKRLRKDMTCPVWGDLLSAIATAEPSVLHWSGLCATVAGARALPLIQTLATGVHQRRGVSNSPPITCHSP